MTPRNESSTPGPEIVVRGSGSRVGYLHGFVCEPTGQPFLDALAGKGFEVVAPSLPGFGRTPPADDLRGIHDWVWHLSDIVDRSGLAGCPLVASSIGAMLALELAAVRPEAFSRLVLIGPLGLWDDDDPVTDPFATTLGNQRALLTADPSVTAAFFDDVEGLAPDLAVERTVRRYTARTAAASLVWPLPEFGLVQRIGRVRASVSLIWGADDRIVSPRYAERFADLLDVREISVVVGAGHLAEWDAPEEVAGLVAEALRGGESND